MFILERAFYADGPFLTVSCIETFKCVFKKKQKTHRCDIYINCILNLRTKKDMFKYAEVFTKARNRKKVQFR